jgi:hypothetical protein
MRPADSAPCPEWQGDKTLEKDIHAGTKNLKRCSPVADDDTNRHHKKERKETQLDVILHHILRNHLRHQDAPIRKRPEGRKAPPPRHKEVKDEVGK